MARLRKNIFFHFAWLCTIIHDSHSKTHRNHKLTDPMEEFTGQESIQIRESLLREHLNDPAWLASSIPDAKIVETTNNSAKWTAEPAIPFLTGAIETTLTVVPTDAPNMIRHDIHAESRGSGCDVTALFNIQGAENTSTVDWHFTIVNKIGLMKMVPSVLLKKFAGEAIEKAWAGLREKLEAE